MRLAEVPTVLDFNMLMAIADPKAFSSHIFPTETGPFNITENTAVRLQHLPVIISALRSHTPQGSNERQRIDADNTLTKSHGREINHPTFSTILRLHLKRQ